MKTDITLNGVKVTKNIPICWDEVPFRQLLELAGLEKDEDIISVFTGIDTETLLKAKIHNLSMLKAAIQFTRSQEIDYIVPKSILGFPIKDNIEIEEIARYADLEAIIKGFGDDGKENMKQFPLMVATYVVEPYNFKDAENLAPRFLDAPAMEVLAVANFIRVNMTVLSVIMPKILQLEASQRNSKRRGLKSFLRRLAFSLFWYLWKRRFPSPVKNYLHGRFKSLSLI